MHLKRLFSLLASLRSQPRMDTTVASPLPPTNEPILSTNSNLTTPQKKKKTQKSVKRHPLNEIQPERIEACADEMDTTVDRALLLQNSTAYTIPQERLDGGQRQSHHCNPRQHNSNTAAQNVLCGRRFISAYSRRRLRHQTTS